MREFKEVKEMSFELRDLIDVLEGISTGQYSSSVISVAKTQKRNIGLNENGAALLLLDLDLFLKNWKERTSSFVSSLQEKEPCPGHYYRKGRCVLCGEKYRD